MEKYGKLVINQSIRFSMKIIKFNKTRFLKDLDFISRNRKSNFSNKANIVKKFLRMLKLKVITPLFIIKKNLIRVQYQKKILY